MDRKEAYRAIREKLARGQTKQEIYIELLPKVSFKSDLVQWLAQIPTHEDRVKYGTLN